MMSRGAFLSAFENSIVTFNVDGTEIRIRSWSLAERMQFASFTEQVPERIMAMSLVDDNGQRIFDPESADDLNAIGTIDGAKAEKIANAILQANGVGEDAAGVAEGN